MFLFGKLSKSTTTTLVIGRVPKNKSFWKYIKLLFSDKYTNFDKITLVDKDLILDNSADIE